MEDVLKDRAALLMWIERRFDGSDILDETLEHEDLVKGRDPYQSSSQRGLGL